MSDVEHCMNYLSFQYYHMNNSSKATREHRSTSVSFWQSCFYQDKNHMRFCVIVASYLKLQRVVLILTELPGHLTGVSGHFIWWTIGGHLFSGGHCHWLNWTFFQNGAAYDKRVNFEMYTCRCYQWELKASAKYEAKRMLPTMRDIRTSQKTSETPPNYSYCPWRWFKSNSIQTVGLWSTSRFQPRITSQE